jgi:hypothetical protein
MNAKVSAAAQSSTNAATQSASIQTVKGRNVLKGDVMSQGWWTVIGLLLALAGFGCLLKQLLNDLAKLRSHPAIVERTLLKNGRAPERDSAEAIRDLFHWDLRYASFGVCLVLIGFALQILGAWPGGFPRLGVYP